MINHTVDIMAERDLWKRLLPCHSELSDFKYEFKDVIPSTETC